MMSLKQKYPKSCKILKYLVGYTDCSEKEEKRKIEKKKRENRKEKILLKVNFSQTYQYFFSCNLFSHSFLFNFILHFLIQKNPL